MRPARKFPRYPLDTRIEITASGLAGTRHLWGLAGDIGEDGISATVSDQLSVGEAVSLKFGVGESIEIRAIVRFHRGLFYGFEFLLLNEQAQQLVRAFLNRVVIPKLTAKQMEAAERQVAEWEEQK